jgi:hypothetical protein
MVVAAACYHGPGKKPYAKLPRLIGKPVLAVAIIFPFGMGGKLFTAGGKIAGAFGKGYKRCTRCSLGNQRLDMPQCVFGIITSAILNGSNPKHGQLGHH